MTNEQIDQAIARTNEQRNRLIDQAIAMLNEVCTPHNGTLGPVKRVYKVPEPARVTPPPQPEPLRLPEEAPKEPVKAA